MARSIRLVATMFVLSAFCAPGYAGPDDLIPNEGPMFGTVVHTIQVHTFEHCQQAYQSHDLWKKNGRTEVNFKLPGETDEIVVGSVQRVNLPVAIRIIEGTTGTPRLDTLPISPKPGSIRRAAPKTEKGGERVTPPSTEAEGASRDDLGTQGPSNESSMRSGIFLLLSLSGNFLLVLCLAIATQNHLPLLSWLRHRGRDHGSPADSLAEQASEARKERQPVVGRLSRMTSTGLESLAKQIVQQVKEGIEQPLTISEGGVTWSMRVPWHSDDPLIEELEATTRLMYLLRVRRSRLQERLAQGGLETAEGSYILEIRELDKAREELLPRLTQLLHTIVELDETSEANGEVS